MKPPKRPVTDYINKINNCDKSLYLHPMNPVEIQRLIEALPNKKSSGHDDISNVVLKRKSVLL